MRADITVLVLNDEPRLAGELALALPADPGVRIQHASEATVAAAAIHDGAADVAVVDLASEAGLALVRLLHQASENARVLAVSSEQSPKLIADALGAGACGVISTSLEPATLLDSFRRAVAGELVLPASALAGAVGRIRGGLATGEEQRLRSLSARERQILDALAHCRATDEIAAALGISRMTVQSHVKSILAKLGLHSKVEAVSVAWRHGSGAATPRRARG